MGEWRDMNTAPRDGSRFLAYVSSKNDEANIVEIWWEPDYIESDYGMVGGWDDDWDLNHQPKAWMPRPPQPKWVHNRERD